jgi:hypothetical protein
MESRVKDRSPQQQTLDEVPESEQRWGSVLQKVVDEQQTNDPWYVKLGTSLIWAAGIALVAGIAAALVLGIRALLSANVQYTFRNLSDHIFWCAALLMIVGMFSPSAAEMDRSRGKKQPQERKSLEERRSQALERRVRRVYDPWRWRIWGGAALTFGLAILSGLLAQPVP